MHEFVFILLFITVVHLQCYAGLKCKAGLIVDSIDPGMSSTQEKVRVEECDASFEYCAAVTCTKGGRLGFSRISWWCAPIKRTHFDCAKQFVQVLEKFVTRSKGIWCECHYGEKGKDMGNEQIMLLPIPNGLMCKLGQFDANGIGGLLEGKCLHDDHYCFMARCNKGNEYFKTEWGCAGGQSLISINQQIGEAAKAMVNCEAMFGQKDVDFSNENFTIDMVDLETTTTSKRQLAAITKDFPTTTTSTSITITKPTIEQSTTSTNEGNGVYDQQSSTCFWKIFPMGFMLSVFHVTFAGCHLGTL
ncbi:hypothetical protein niasHS_008113 [Heterodera schachtii]|uniref:Uncharacterized protein n=1 Tax=Heterodera schachtii TaxID=97005 RepID=A0ABD2JAI4_HETSC